MPVIPTDPLRKCTLNLFDADVEYLQTHYGHGYSVTIRQMISDAVAKLRARPPTIADLITEELSDD